jgi:methionyl aminopeptidase
MIVKKKPILNKYKQICNLSMKILKNLYDSVDVGVSPIEIDRLARDLTKKHEVKSAFKNVISDEGVMFGHPTCIMINEDIVHGVPRKDYKFQEGDIITVDFGIIKDGYYTDHCFTVGLGDVDEKDLKLMKIGRDAVLAGVNKAITGNRTGDVGHAIHATALNNGCDTVKMFAGHGIGLSMHEHPDLPTFGIPGTGAKLKKGMLMCVEAQITWKGHDDLTIGSDSWTAKTRDGSTAVMFEYIVGVDNEKPLILTDNRHWGLVKD